jgi:hypothetical protein
MMQENTEKTVKRRLVTLFILMILVVPGLVAFAPARQEQPDISLLVNAGYNRYYRRGLWTPLRVSVSNNGGDLVGYIRVRTGETNSLEEITYRTPIDLPRGARKQVFLYVSLDKLAERVQVEVVDRSGHVVKRESMGMLLAMPEDVLYAVVTESAFGAVDLAALSPGTGDGHQTNWRIPDIPTLADALAGLDVIMFHDADTGNLSAEQQAALATWVLAGGHLIVAGGDSWQRTTAGLLDLLPVSLRGTVPLSSVTPLADYLHLSSEALNEGMTATDSEPKPSAQVLASVGDTPLIVRQAVGGGLVDFLAVDPHAEPLRSWPDRQYLWYALVTSVGQEPSWANGFSYWPAAREATLTTFSNILPTFFQLCGFLLLYIIILGPINYLVLKRLNRREWAWVTIPAMIAIFGVLAYQVGFNLRGNVPTINRLTVVRAWPDSEQAQVISLIGVQSPRRDTYDITVERGYSLRPLPEQGIGLNVPTIIDEGTRYAAQSIPIDGGTIASLVAGGSTAVPDLDASTTWYLSDTQAPHIVGTITNTLGVPLQDAVVLVKGAAQVLNTIAPGETVTFDIPIGPSDPGPLAVGNAGRFYSSYSYGWPYGYRGAGWCYSYSGLYLTISDVMQGEGFSCGANRVTARQQEIRRRYRLLGALIVDTDLSGGRGSDAFLFAWIDQAVVDIELGDRPQNEEDTTLYIFELPVTVQGSGQWVEVPPGLTTWTIIEAGDPSTMREVNPSVSFQISPEDQAVFQFMPLPAMRLETVDELVIKFQGQGSLGVELWNWQIQRWVTIHLSPDLEETTIPNASRYVGPANAVNIRVLSHNPTAYNRVESVKVAYHGRLAG